MNTCEKRSRESGGEREIEIDLNKQKKKWQKLPVPFSFLFLSIQNLIWFIYLCTYLISILIWTGLILSCLDNQFQKTTILLKVKLSDSLNLKDKCFLLIIHIEVKNIHKLPTILWPFHLILYQSRQNVWRYLVIK